MSKKLNLQLLSFKSNTLVDSRALFASYRRCFPILISDETQYSPLNSKKLQFNTGINHKRVKFKE